MKITLYIRSTKPGHCEMHTLAVEEPNYDTPRTINLGNEIRSSIDAIIDRCVTDGAVYYGGKSKDLKLKA